jgi:hypothetical protein
MMVTGLSELARVGVERLSNTAPQVSGFVTGNQPKQIQNQINLLRSIVEKNLDLRRDFYTNLTVK